MKIRIIVKLLILKGDSSALMLPATSRIGGSSFRNVPLLIRPVPAPPFCGDRQKPLFPERFVGTAAPDNHGAICYRPDYFPGNFHESPVRRRKSRLRPDL
ncbi:hypothetical protein [Nevskia sp.]|uniref:hypothetical protein n=1 Tax=Nevskia sp. TaxID=1929292 RepID=UPI003F6F16E9